MIELYDVLVYFFFFFLSSIHEASLLQGHSQDALRVLDAVLGSGDTLVNSQSSGNGNCSKVWFDTRREPGPKSLPHLQEPHGGPLQPHQHGRRGDSSDQDAPPPSL